MKFKDYIKDKLLLIILLVLAILSIETLLLAYQILPIIRIYIAVILILVVAIAMGIEYYKKKNFYNKLKQDLEELNEKYLISEIINTPNFTEGKILKEVILETGKSMLENVNIYKNIQEDYKEYIELWIHEIKIPIATSKLIIENNKSNVTRSIDEELDKIDNYTEQALYYARSNDANKDYIITKTSLKEIVNMAVLKNKTNLLNNKVTVNLQEGLDKEVYTDSKWAVFILNQIIQNSIKYAKEADKTIEIFSEEKKEKVILYIKDNGIGIKKEKLQEYLTKDLQGKMVE